MKSEFLKVSAKEWTLHFLLWGLLIVSLIFGRPWTKVFPDNGVTYLMLTVVLPIYINAFILIPRYFKRSKWSLYIFLLLALILIINLLDGLLVTLNMIWDGKHEIDFFEQWFKFSFRSYQSFDNLIFSGTTWPIYISFAYRFIKDWIVNDQVKGKLISENLSMELALLKSQLNPHFLFNTLNNIYAVALEEKAVKTAGTISKLGTLMRYSLQEAQTDFISLSKEIDYIQGYVEMQELRTMDKDQISIKVDIGDSEISNEKIAPMILMPLIENAFKYGISTTKKSIIDIVINYSDGTLSLLVQNSILTNSGVTTGGIGLSNVKNRLRLIYPDRHVLENEISGDLYRVKLEINL